MYHDPPTPVPAMRCWIPGYRAETIAGPMPLRVWLLLRRRESGCGVRYDRLSGGLLLLRRRHRGTVRGGYCCGDADGGSSGVGVTPSLHFPVCEAGRTRNMKGRTWRVAGVGCACGVEGGGGRVRLLPCRWARRARCSGSCSAGREAGRRFRRDWTGGPSLSDVESGYLCRVRVVEKWLRISGDTKITRFRIPRF